jgi:hypothetical protein
MSGWHMSTPEPPPDFVTASPVGRPKLHASGAARTSAYRRRNVRLDVTLTPAIADTLASIASDLDCSRNALLASMVRFALTNRNWRQIGLFGSGEK